MSQSACEHGRRRRGNAGQPRDRPLLAGSLDAGPKGRCDRFERERNERVARFNETRKERRQYNERVRNVMKAQT